MPDPSTRPPVTRFGVFEVDLRAGELRRNGSKVKLQEQPFQILVMLLERPGELVTREEIQKKLWSEDTFVDFEHSVATAVKKLREALGDSADNPRFVETLPRRGYRFIYPVAPVGPRPDLVGDRRTEAAAHRAALQRWIALGVGIAVVVLAVLLALNVAGLRDRFMRRAVPVPKIESIAVLPLENLSGDKDQEYFADGMTEALITDLGKISALRVISRTSVMHYKETKKTLPEIARELNVDAIIEGTVQRSGNHVRITANLLHAPTDRHLWAETYERDLRDVLVLQSEVAQAIAREVQIKLTPQEQARLARARPVNPEAHALYLKGRYYWWMRTEKDLWKSIEYFQQAIARDPIYAPPYSGLADAYSILGNNGFVRADEASPKARVAALRALELDTNLAEAHVALGRVFRNYDWDWSRAEAEYRRAIELNPNSADAHLAYAALLSLLGRHEEALAVNKRGRELDPLAIRISAHVGAVLYFARRYDEAIEELRKALDLDPNDGMTHLVLGKVYLQKGTRQEALAELERGSSLLRGASVSRGFLIYGYAVAGKRLEARKAVAALPRARTEGNVSPYNIALAHLGLGDKDQTIIWLERTYAEREPRLPFINVEPAFDPLRSDPRFQDLLRRMNFPK